MRVSCYKGNRLHVYRKLWSDFTKGFDGHCRGIIIPAGSMGMVHPGGMSYLP